MQKPVINNFKVDEMDKIVNYSEKNKYEVMRRKKLNMIEHRKRRKKKWRVMMRKKLNMIEHRKKKEEEMGSKREDQVRR